MEKFRGIWTALATPFDGQGKIDENAYRKLLQMQIAAGVAGVVPCGTTGESPTLSTEEKQWLIRTAIEAVKGSPVRVMAGTGTNDTEETVELSKWAASAGAHALLVVTPYYNKPTQRGLEAHFEAVARAAGIPIVVYNVPGRTGVQITSETLVRLLTIENIRAIKEASGNVEFSSEIIARAQAAGRTIDLLSGDDTTFLPHLAAGCAGLISVASNVVPRELVALQATFEAGRVHEAIAEFQRLYPFCRDLFIETNPVPVKFVLSQLGVGSARVRLPLAPLSPTNEALLSQSYARVAKRL